MQRTRVIVLDRDGTIIKHIHYLGQPDKVKLNIDIKIFIEWAIANNIKIFIHSNQSGIERGLFTFNDLLQVHIEMLYQLDIALPIKTFYASHFKSKFRKPRNSIFQAIKRDIPDIIEEQVVYIGDTLTDKETATNIGFRYFLLTTGLNKPINEPKLYSSFNSGIIKCLL